MFSLKCPCRIIQTQTLNSILNVITTVSTESNKRRVTKNKDEFGGIFFGEREESFVTLIIRTYSKFCNENYKMIDFY